MKKNIIIIWAWLHAEVITNIISYDLNNNFIWYLDDNKKWYNILWKIKDFLNYIDNYYFICAIWDNTSRDIIFNKIKSKWWKFINAIHPQSYIEKWVLIWEWVMVWANTYINICSQIWDNTIINNWVIVEHHNIIWNSCHLSPWVISWWHIKIENNVFLWLNTLINDEIVIEKNVFSWSWTVINRNVEKNSIIIGVPYKIIKKIWK